MDSTTNTLTSAKKLLGKMVRFGQRRYRVIELLADSAELVLEAVSDNQTIQPDQHGHAHRKVPLTIVIPVFSADQQQFHPQFMLIQELHDEH